MSGDASEFSLQKFSSDSWEEEVKRYVSEIRLSDLQIWYRNRANKKINEELVTLGHYAKYCRAFSDPCWFRLLESDEKGPDAEIGSRHGRIETVQIAIAHYDSPEADFDRRFLGGEDLVKSGWVGERALEMSNRIVDRVTKKSKINYVGVDTLCIGTRGWFVRWARQKDPSLLERLKSHCERVNPRCFKKVVIVDSDLIGQGEMTTLWQRSGNLDCGGLSPDSP